MWTVWPEDCGDVQTTRHWLVSCVDPSKLFHKCVVTALCFIETSSLHRGRRKDTHTWGMGVDAFSPRALCLLAFFYRFPRLFWVSVVCCFAVFWRRDTVALLEHKGDWLTSSHSECADRVQIKSWWLCFIGQCGQISIGCQSDLVSATWLSLHVSVLKYLIFLNLPAVRQESLKK